MSVLEAERAATRQKPWTDSKCGCKYCSPNRYYFGRSGGSVGCSGGAELCSHCGWNCCIGVSGLPPDARLLLFAMLRIVLDNPQNHPEWTSWQLMHATLAAVRLPRNKNINVWHYGCIRQMSALFTYRNTHSQSKGRGRTHCCYTQLSQATGSKILSQK